MENYDVKYKIFVINLDKSRERLEQLSAGLSRVGLKFERISAVDGRLLDETQILEHYSPSLNRKKYFVPLTKSEIGCYLSHLKTYKKITSENIDFAIILEDDILVKDGFQIIPKLISSIKLKWNYIKLISYGRKKKIVSRTPLIISGDYSDFELVSWRKPPVGTAGYAITRECAEILIKNRSLFFRPIDVDLQYTWELNLDIMGLLPSYLEPAGVASTIPKRKSKYHYPFARLIYDLKYELSLFRYLIHQKIKSR